MMDEVILDHLIHTASNEYVMLLTDAGNVHIHSIYTEVNNTR